MNTGKGSNTGRDMNASPATPEAGLEMLFEAARASPPSLPEGLHARLIADAEATLAIPPLPTPGRSPQPRLSANRAPQRRRSSFAAASGLLAAAAAGLWMGFAAPGPLSEALPVVMTGFGIAPQVSAEDADLEVILLAFDDFLDEG